ncbi:MAG: type I methionyl aminopeptidase [Candidatus Paceibacterota bacterium]
MINYKASEEIELMRQSGKILQSVFKKVVPHAKPGISTIELDKIAEEEILANGAKPSFKTVSGYEHSTNICINEQIVHTPPSDRLIKQGDVVTIDSGVLFKGFHTDSAVTFQVGAVTPEVKRFLDVGKQTLKKAIAVTYVGNYISDVSETIQTGIEAAGYQVSYELTGHGVGKILHEDPIIPGFVKKHAKKKILIKSGMTLAIEVIYAQGSGQITSEQGSNWSLITTDKSLSACFENTVAVVQDKTFILA